MISLAPRGEVEFRITIRAPYAFVVPYTWSIESIIGYLRSTSVASTRILGDKATAFDAAPTAALLAHDPSGRYSERLRFGYTLGRMRG